MLALAWRPYFASNEEFNKNSLPVMQKVVCHVIADVAKDASAVCSYSCIPVVEEDCMREFPEGQGEDDEEGRWHDEAVAVHGEVVVNAV